MPDDLPAAVPATARTLAAIPPKAGGHIEAFVPRSIEEIKWTVGLLIDAGLAPDSFKNDPKKITVAVLKGLEVGLPPLMAVSNIAVINGRASIWGDAALALVQSRNVIERMEVEEIGTLPEADAETGRFPPDYGFSVKIWRKGQSAPYTGKFTVGDAKRAKLWMNAGKAPWMQHPKRMLKIRATAFPLRDGFADCLAGLSIREEVEDLPPAPAAVTSTDFLDDAKAPKIIEHLAEPTPQAAATPAEPSGAAKPQAEPSSVGGGDGNGAGPSSAGPSDIELWRDGVMAEIARAKSHNELEDLRLAHDDTLAAAPKAIAEQVSRQFAERRKALGK